MMFMISPILAVIALSTVPVSLVADEVHRRQGPPAVHRPVAAHRHAQRPGRGGLHRPRHREELRAATRGRGPVPQGQRRAVRGELRRPVHVQPDPADDDLHGQHPVRPDRRRRWPEDRQRLAEHRRHAGDDPVRPPVLPADDQPGVDGGHVPVGHRLDGAGARTARRRRAVARAGRHRRRRARCAAGSCSTTSTSPTSATSR